MKQALVDVAFAVELQSCREIVVEDCADEDPWHGFTLVIERLTDMNVRNRGFVDAFMSADPAADAFAYQRSKIPRRSPGSCWIVLRH
jgi:hypothetical protein